MAWVTKDQSTDDWGSSGFKLVSTNGNIRPYRWDLLSSKGFSPYGTVLSLAGSTYPIIMYVDVFGNLAVWSSNKSDWNV